MSESSRADVESLVAELAEIRKYIESLQNTISQLASELQEIRLSKSALEALSGRRDVDTLISLDRRGHTYVRGLITEVKSVVAHIGSNYYAEVPVEVAVKLLNEKEGDVMRALQSVEGELNKVVSYYQQLQEALGKALKAQQIKSGR